MNSAPRRRWTPADFAAVDVPTLVIAGTKDAIIPVEDARAIAAAIPGARLVEYPEAGHVPMEQLPDRSAADLAAFLESLPPRGAPPS